MIDMLIITCKLLITLSCHWRADMVSHVKGGQEQEQVSNRYTCNHNIIYFL